MGLGSPSRDARALDPLAHTVLILSVRVCSVDQGHSSYYNISLIDRWTQYDAD
jgi:hypothetical protein